MAERLAPTHAYGYGQIEFYLGQVFRSQVKRDAYDREVDNERSEGRYTYVVGPAAARFAQR